MPPTPQTAYIVFDTESVVDGALVSRVLYPGESLAPDKAIARLEAELRDRQPGKKPFIPVSFHVPVAIAVARVDAKFRLTELSCLDAPNFDPPTMVAKFWSGVEYYKDATLVDFNGRGFDIPLLTLSAFRFGISCPRYFADSDRFGFRYRYTAKHIDLLEWLTEYGAFGLKGGLNLLAKMLGKPGKTETKGDQVSDMYASGKIQEINDYCLHDVLDTYFVFLRTRVLAGQLLLESEQEIVAAAKEWLQDRSTKQRALEPYLEDFGTWDPVPFH